MKRVVVLVSGGGTNLQALIDAQAKDALTGARIVGVVSSSPKAYALERAAAAGIPGYVVARKDYGSREEFTHALTLKLLEIKADILVLAGFLYICTGELFSHFRQVVNVHPALIPSFCGEGYYGLKVHEKVLEAGVKVTGATVHLVTEDVDAGPILLQKAVDVLPGDTPETLQRRVMEQCEWVLLPRAVSLLAQDKVEVQGRRTILHE